MDERSRLFVRDIEPEPGWEVCVFEPGDEIPIEPGTWTEMVPLSEMEGAVETILELVEAGRAASGALAEWEEHERWRRVVERVLLTYDRGR